MKKFLSIIMAMVLFFTMSLTVFAAKTEPSITITNATVGQTYYLYKIFDASYARDSAGNTKVDANGKAIVSYTIDKNNQFFDDLFGTDGKKANEYFTYSEETGVVTRKDGV